MTRISYGARWRSRRRWVWVPRRRPWPTASRSAVLGDQSNVAADAGGLGAVAATRMAIADATANSGGKVAGMSVEVVSADFLTKPDNAVQIAKRWYESEGVDAITDLPYSGAGLAVQNVAGADKKIVLIAGAATSDITGKGCNTYATQWSDDTYSLARGDRPGGRGAQAARNGSS